MSRAKARTNPKAQATSLPPKPYTDLVTESAVEQLMSGDGGLGVIDFWAPWCAPCRAVAPHFEAVAARYAGAEPRVGFYKVNTEASPRLAAAFNIRSIPTMIFVQDGEIRDVVVGALDGSRLAAKVDWLRDKASGRGFWQRLLGGKAAAAEATPVGGDPTTRKVQP